MRHIGQCFTSTTLRWINMEHELIADATVHASSQGNGFESVQLHMESLKVASNGGSVECIAQEEDAALARLASLADSTYRYSERLRFDNNFVSVLYNFGFAKRKKYEQSYEMRDLDDAIRLNALACSLTPKGHLHCSSRLIGWATCLGLRYERLSDLEDINGALCLGLKALSLGHKNPPEYATCLNSLGSFHALRYERLGDVADLQTAISLIREVMNHVTCLYSEDMVKYYSNLGCMLSWRFNRVGNVTDFEEAVALLRSAIAEPYTEPSRGQAMLMSNLADLLASDKCHESYTRSHAESYFYYVKIWYYKSAPPLLRLRAAQKASSYLNACGEWQKSSELLREAVSFLSAINSDFLSRADQQYVLKKFGSLSTLTASVMLQAGESQYDILRVLENGRGIISRLCLRQSGDVRSRYPIHNSPCKSHKPYLATTHEYLTHNEGEPNESRTEHDPEHFFHQDNARFKCQLRQAVPSGTMVIINESPIRCDAIVVRGGEVGNVRLNNLSSHDITAWNEALKKIRDGKETEISRPRQQQILESLWDTIACPILDALGLKEKPVRTKEWPRLWWVLTGQLCQLPIHAAGKPNHNFSESVMNRVISSYSPSIRALFHSRRESCPVYSRALGHMMVGMAKTPSLPELACAKEEVDAAAKLSRCKSVSILENPTKHNVLSKISAAHVFHFAGHGKFNRVSPLNSCLALDDWQRDPLSVDNLLTLNLNRCGDGHFLAYLSACGTGMNAADNLQDESINFMSAFQIAGFRHTIGSLWDVKDTLAVDMAREFYSYLGRNTKVSDDTVAISLHQAARRLRSRASSYSDEDYLSWAAYIHSGP